MEPPETLIFQGVPLVEVAGFIRKLNRRSRHCRAFRSFRLTRSPSFRLRRTAHCADGRLTPPRPYRPRVRLSAIDIAKRRHPQGASPFCCRSGGIRTRGLLVPNQTRYQAALHLDNGADEGTRTPDLLITNRLLYQLSHIGTTSTDYYNKVNMVCP